MKAGEAIAEILKREGVEIIFGYPVNHILEYAARAGIRPIIVRQERIGLHMADAHVAADQRREDRRVRDAARPRRRERVRRHRAGLRRGGADPGAADGLSAPHRARPAQFNSVLNMRHVTKSAEPVTSGAEVPNILRRAFTRLKSGRGGPVLVEVPVDVFDEEVPEPLAYAPATMPGSGPIPRRCARSRSALPQPGAR